jgi:hypothetical protein
MLCNNTHGTSTRHHDDTTWYPRPFSHVVTCAGIGRRGCVVSSTGIASEILTALGNDALDIITLKVARLCAHDLRHAQATGLCVGRLWGILVLFRDYSASDQQDIGIVRNFTHAPSQHPLYFKSVQTWRPSCA